MKKLYLLLALAFWAQSSFAQWERQSPLPFPPFSAEGSAFSTSDRGYIVGNAADGFFDPPGRVLETTDGGATWHERIMNPDGQDMNTVFFYDDNYGWMAGNRGYKTTDGGVTWIQMDNLPAGSFYHLKFITQDFGWAISNGGLQVTTDGGDSWTYHGYNSGDMDAGDFFSTTLGLGWGEGNLKKTTDGGDSWNTVLSAGIIGARWLTATTAVAVSTNDFYYSTDAGDSWTLAHTSTAWSPPTGPRLLVMDEQNVVAHTVTGVVLHSDDGGQTWTENALSADDNVIYNATWLNVTTALLTTANAGIYRTTNSGQSWTKVFSGPDTPIWTVTDQDGTNLWAAGNYGLIVRSTDGGASWDFFSDGIAQSMEDIHFFTDQRGIAVGHLGFVLYTENGGQTWTPARHGFDLEKIHVLNDQFATVVGEATVLKTTDGGLNWQVMPNPGSSYHLVDAHFLNPNLGWIVSEYPAGGIFKTSDGGQTWEVQYLDGGFPFKAIEMLDEDLGYAAGPADGIFKTTDGGQTWDFILFDPFAPDAMIDMDFVDAQTGWIVGEFGYIAKTTDGGQTWTEQPFPGAGFLNDVTEIIAFDTQEAWATTRQGDLLHTTDGGQNWNIVPSDTDAVYPNINGFEINSTGIWLCSNEIFFNGTITSGGNCATPNDLTVSNISDNSAFLQWTGNPNALSYNIRYRPVGTDTWTTVTSNLTSITLSGLTNDVTYECQVQSDCGGTTSNFSASVTFTTLVVPCDPPTALTVDNVTDTSALVSWNGFAGAVSYDLEYRIVGEPAWTTVSVTTTSYTLTGLSFDTDYEVRVKTVCNPGNSEYTDPVVFTTLSPTCTPPTDLHVTNLSSSGATAVWNDHPSGVSYTVQWRALGSTDWLEIITGSNYHFIGGLDENTTYEYRVRTNCLDGSSGFTAIETFTTLDGSCATPTGLSVSNLDPDHALLSWDAMPEAISYIVQYRVAGTNNWITVNNVSTFYDANGLMENTTYEWRVRTLCASGDSPYSAIQSFTTPQDTCFVPTGLTATNISDTEATVSWDEVGSATSYDLQYRVSGNTGWTTVIASFNNYTLTGLAPNTTYEYRVRSVCGGPADMSAYSAIAAFTTTSDPCDTPTGLTADNISSTEATISWNAVAAATAYDLQHRESGTTTWTTVNVTTNSHLLTGLTANTTYEYRLRSVCSGGTSDYSTIATFTTADSGGDPSDASFYCDSEGLDATQEWIDYVALADLSHPSGSDGGYADNTNLSASLDAGADYDLTFSCDKLNSRSTVYFRIWIDFNLDGDFTDPQEEIVSCSVSHSGNEVQAFTVPAGAPTGDTRLRVSMKHGDYPAPCETFARGEVEDYTVTIGGAAPTCDPPGGLTAGNITTTGATLSWNAVGSAQSYNVQYRVPGAPDWTTLSTTTTSLTLSGLTAGTAYEFRVESVCNGDSSDYTASVTFTTLTDACEAPTGLTASNVTTNSATLSWNMVGSALSYNLQYRLSGDPNWTTLNGTGTSQNLTGLTAASVYEYRVESVCDGETSGYSAAANFTTLSPSSYCSSAGNDATQEWIDYVGLPGIDNPTGSDGGYGDYTGLSAGINAGETYDLTFSCDKLSSRSNVYFRIWIDFNGDGDYTDSGEEVVSRIVGHTGNESHAFTVPAGAATGSTRMRVSMKYGGFATPCENFARGEVEDYTVVISDGGGTNQFQGSALSMTMGQPLRFEVYPVPAISEVTIHLAEAPDQPLQLTLADTYGRVRLTRTLAPGTVQERLPVHDLSDGIFFLRIAKEGEAPLATRRIMVLRR